MKSLLILYAPFFLFGTYIFGIYGFMFALVATAIAYIAGGLLCKTKD